MGKIPVSVIFFELYMIWTLCCFVCIIGGVTPTKTCRIKSKMGKLSIVQ